MVDGTPRPPRGAATPRPASLARSAALESKFTPPMMSQTSPTPKAEPEASSSTTTPVTQTPAASYTPTSWASSRSYQHLNLGL
jgi:hypothetical protein